MASTLKRTDPANPAGWEQVALGVSSVGNNQAAVLAQSMLVQFAFQVLSVTAWAQAVTATASVDVRIGATSVLTGLITPSSGTTDPAAGTLVTSIAGRRGAAGTTLRLYVTTNGTGALTNLLVNVTLRAYPMNNEA